jgi:hypothetical protein
MKNITLQRLIKSLLLASLGTVVTTQVSYAELIWSSQPSVKQQQEELKHQQMGHAQHGGNREKAYYLRDGEKAQVSYYSPDLSQQTLNAENNSDKYVLPKTGMDNYHALIAQRSTEKIHESALRYPYMRGKPSGESPKKVIRSHKLPLEIVPDPMVREHWRFYSQNTHRFQILFNEKPLSNSWVILKTSNDSTIELASDQDGFVEFTLPDDFSDIKPGRRANKPAEFMLRTAHVDGDKTYTTNFTESYSVNPSHWNSNLGGVITLSLGFLSGIVIMRKHNNKVSLQKNNKKPRGAA